MWSRFRIGRTCASACLLAFAACGDADSASNAGTGAPLPPPDAGMDAGTATILPLAGRPSPPPFVHPPDLDAGPLPTPDGGLDAGPADSLGARCLADRDCAAPLVCLALDDDIGTGGAPPRGLCTVPCSADSTQCGDLGGTCIDFTGGGWPTTYCIETCSFGPGDQVVFSADKCHGREELSCYPLNDGPGCLANCNGDVDCATRICNPGTGLCDNSAPPGDALGAKCDPDGTTDTCRGYCSRYALPADAGTTGACMEDCTFGRVATCGWTGSGVAQAACFLFPTSVLDAGGPGYGDIGNCVQLCNCNQDCLHPDFICEPLGTPEWEAYYGRKGFCGPKGVAGDIPACM